MKLSASDLDIVAKYPLGLAFDSLRDELRKADEAFPPAPRDGTFLEPAGPRLLMTATDKLLAELRYHAAASRIKSNLGTLDIYTELQTITGRMARNFNYEHFRPLAQLVIRLAPDTEVWTAVLNLITNLSRTTPPPSAPASFDGTPVIRSSSSFQGREQTKQMLDVALVYELTGRIFRDVGGFYNKYFEGCPWTKRCEQIYNNVKLHHVGGRWVDFPNPPAQDDVWDWLARFQSNFLSDAAGRYYTTKSANSIAGGDAPRQLDIFLKSSTVATSSHDWKDVLVVGEHKQSHHAPKELLLQLSRYMRDVFSCQPTRRFVHGFLLHGSKMEAWVFDRSGPYSSGEFDIHEEPEKFIRILAGYALMNDEELGLDTFVRRRGARRNITIERDTGEKKRILQLDPEPFVKQRAVVCRGTTCFRTTDHGNVVKFSWTSDKRPPEEEHLRLAHEKGVRGIARLVGYQSITSISELRSGLVFGRPWRIRGTTALEPSSTQSHLSHSLRLLQFNGRARGKSVDLSNIHTPISSRHGHPWEMGEQSSLPASVCNTKKRRSAPGDDAVPAKRPRNNGQSSKLHGELDAEASVSLYERNHDTYENRLFGCLAISPSGRALIDFTSISELLTALRDAIKAHRSLYLTGRILHRDISENNIIITNPKRAGGFTGMLIDLDLAKPEGSGKTGARHQTGTMQFMAIEVLRKATHTYRHDLESFFYVLLWMCGRRMWERGFLCSRKERPTKDVLGNWYRGSFDEIALSKQGVMHADGFKELLGQFPPALDRVKHLCSQIRRILFPLTLEGELDIGTPPDPDDLYDRIIKEYDDAISRFSTTI